MDFNYLEVTSFEGVREGVAFLGIAGEANPLQPLSEGLLSLANSSERRIAFLITLGRLVGRCVESRVTSRVGCQGLR